MVLGVLCFFTYIMLITSWNTASTNFDYLTQVYQKDVDKQKLAMLVFNRISRMRTIHMLTLIVVVIGVVYNIFISIWQKQQYWDSPYSIVLGFLSLFTVFACILVYNNTSTVAVTWKKMTLEEKISTAEDLFSYSYNWTIIAIIVFAVFNSLCIAIVKDLINPLIERQQQSGNIGGSGGGSGGGVRQMPSLTQQSNFQQQQFASMIAGDQTGNIPTLQPVPVPNIANTSQSQAQKEIRNISLLPGKFAGKQAIEPKNLELYHKIIQKFKTSIAEKKHIFTPDTMSTFSKFSLTFLPTSSAFNRDHYIHLLNSFDTIFGSMEHILVSSPTENVLKLHFSMSLTQFGKAIELIQQEISKAFQLIFEANKINYIYEMNQHLQDTIYKNRNLFFLSSLNVDYEPKLKSERDKLDKLSEKILIYYQRSYWIEHVELTKYGADKVALIKETGNIFQQCCLLIIQFIHYHLQNIRYSFDIASEFVNNNKFDKIMKWN